MKSTLYKVLIMAMFFSSGFLTAEDSIERMFTKTSSILKLETSPRAKGPQDLYETFGNESIRLSFPAKISLKKKDGLLMATSKKGKAEFGLLAPKPAVSVYPANIFSLIIADMDTKPLTLVSINEYTNEYGQVMELVSVNRKKKKVIRSKTIVTPYNFYLLAVEYPEKNGDPGCDQFLNSLQIK